MKNEELIKKIGRDEAVTEYLTEVIRCMEQGLLSPQEAQLRLDTVLEMEDIWRLQEDEGSSPFDNTQDAEADYQ